MEKVTHITQQVPVGYTKALPMSDKDLPQTNVNATENLTVEKAVSALNDFLKPIRRNIKFEFHDKLEKYYVTVVDSDTNQVIREIPTRKILDMYAEMADFMGFLIDKKV